MKEASFPNQALREANNAGLMLSLCNHCRVVVLCQGLNVQILHDYYLICVHYPLKEENKLSMAG